MLNEKLFDEHGIPKAYSMVKALEKVEDDINSGTDPGDSGRVPYFNIVTTIREELVGYLEPQEVDRLEELLLDKEFDKAYNFFDEQWEESVQEKLSEDEIEEWDPENTPQI